MKKLGILLAMFFVLAMVLPAWALEIVLEPDNAQREIGGKVRVHIYADGAVDLVSMGVKVSFDPSVLEVTEASKYEDVENGWLLDGDGNPATTDDQYNDPPVEIDNTGGSVTMIGGHMAGESTTGLGGKVLLGWIVFQAKANGNSYLNVDLGKYNPEHPTKKFDNFVNVDKSVDEPTGLPADLGIICVKDDACSGDVNANGTVDMGDFTDVRNAMGKVFSDPEYNVLADVNANGTVDMGDFNIVRSQMGTSGCPSCP